MDFNYIVVYKNPYTNLKKFINFYEISRFVVSNKIYEYTIFERMDGLKEVELTVIDSKIRDLEFENNKINCDKENEKKFFTGIINEKNKKIIEYEKELKKLKKLIKKELGIDYD